jgi:hypothetical protein
MILIILTFVNYKKKIEIYKLISFNNQIVGITFENCQLTNVWESTMWELDMGFVFSFFETLGNSLKKFLKIQIQIYPIF